MQCGYTKSDGQQCRSHAAKGGKFCYFHNPEIGPKEKRAVRSRGGKANKHLIREPLDPIRLKKTKDVTKLLSETINKVRLGEMEINVAKCIGYLAGHLLKSMEISDLEIRLEELEKSVFRNEHGYH